MGKSPAKWIKSVLLGKKPSKSNSNKAKDFTNAANSNGSTAGKEPALSEKFPVISEPVLVSSHNNATMPAIGKAENFSLPNGGSVENMVQIGSNTPVSHEKLREELAAVKAQATFRGYLARRAFRALKGIIRLQAVIRGHLVRRQAVSTLRATLLIVKFQALVRGRNVRLSSAAMQSIVKFGQYKSMGATSLDAWKEKVSSNAYVRKLLSSPISVEALQFQYNEGDPNAAYNWLERWTLSCIWKSVSQPKRIVDGKPQVRKASYSMETHSAKLKRNVRKTSATTTVETFQINMTVEPEKTKRNPRKFSSSHVDSVPDSQLSELEKVKRNLKKATNSMAEASKISNSMAEASKVSNFKADASKVSNSIVDTPKISNSIAEISKITSLVNGISDHQDDRCEKTLWSVPEVSCSENQETHGGSLLEYSDIDKVVPDDLETHFNSVLSGGKVNGPNAVAQAVEVVQNIDTEDNALGKKEETRSKEEPLSNGSLRSSKRRSSFSTNSQYPESRTKNTPVPPRQPSYMAATESLKAKLRGPPRLDSDSSVDKIGLTRRQSLPSAANTDRAIKVDWRR